MTRLLWAKPPKSVYPVIFLLTEMTRWELAMTRGKAAMTTGEDLSGSEKSRRSRQGEGHGPAPAVISKRSEKSHFR
ncbi:hypothetical protein JT06_15285 [Desulfobulbus sp. Tol-SR]|nr:hypothetical protein JT06_15285 [Desulfobulbus sp. Tol-SR]